MAGMGKPLGDQKPVTKPANEKPNQQLKKVLDGLRNGKGHKSY